MIPDVKEARVCVKCHCLVIHPHIAECPECGGQVWYALEELIRLYELEYGEGEYSIDRIEERRKK